MSLRSQILALCLFAAVLAWSPEALSYARSSSIGYTVGTQTLSGYSRTWKDIWDPDYYLTCTYYVWDDIYGYYCYIYNFQINYAHVHSDLNSPTGFYQTTEHTDLYDATATHAVIVSTQNGTWTVTGRHYALVDHYIMYCPYNFCSGPFYTGTSEFSVGSNTSAQWAVIPMTISPYATTSLTDADADSILAGSSSLLQTDNGGGDVACPLTFRRNGNASAFIVGDGIISDQSEEFAVHAVSPRVKVVHQILWCGGAFPPDAIAGCTAGSSTILRRITASNEPQLWAHEYGHTQGLIYDLPTTGWIMSGTASASNSRVTSSECSAMMNPINSR